jgi:hypothetical protein
LGIIVKQAIQNLALDLQLGSLIFFHWGFCEEMVATKVSANLDRVWTIFLGAVSDHGPDPFGKLRDQTGVLGAEFLLSSSEWHW